MSNPTSLYGHDSRINSISICKEFSIIISGSSDCSAIIWDLNTKSYSRCLYGHPSAVTNVSSSSRTGEIVTICSLNDENRQSQLRLWTINGQLVNAINTETAILHSTWTNAQEGINCNAILTAHIDGTIQVIFSKEDFWRIFWIIRSLLKVYDHTSLSQILILFKFWNCLNLSKLRTLVSSESSCISCTLSSDDLFLFTLGSDGLLSIWAQQDQNRDKRKPIVLNFNKE